MPRDRRWLMPRLVAERAEATAAMAPELLQDEQLIFYSAVNEAMEPVWDVRTVTPTFACEDITYDDVLAIE